MANPNGRKGSTFERLIADYFKSQWSEFIDRRVKTGAKDKGDLANVRIGPHKLVVEIKNVIRTNLAGWITEAEQEARNDEALAGIVVHKRKLKGQPGDQYVTMTLDTFFLLLHAARSGE